MKYLPKRGRFSYCPQQIHRWAVWGVTRGGYGHGRKLLRLVAGIYESLVTPEHWGLATRDIHHTLGAAHGALLITDGEGRSVLRLTLPLEAGTSYLEYYQRLDYVLAAVEKGPVGVVRTGSELTDPRNIENFTTIGPARMKATMVWSSV